ncbi:hypothetical protein AOC19_04270 [Polynucleobacter asymbioticus]|uniref:hypothetical protein n=1 Tax=Polynucleobacter asymbioticus TaxID=576611 RepID=UPI001BFD0C64|nr:hypothetical protein [Polynucleobacter asymbioticus]QWD86080.1 hypothetical protein AOC19_04270 [Polynucleobacter asymbioticus]
MAGHGGRRPGSGRRKGSPTEKTTKVARDFVQSEAMTPLEVILRCMSDKVDQGEYEAAFPYAVAAAPYIHAKLGNSQAQILQPMITKVIDEFPYGYGRHEQNPSNVSHWLSKD